jgi:hypothetical protein
MVGTTVMGRILQKCVVAGVSFVLASCASLLPHSKQTTETPWHTYSEAQAMFAKIVPRKTTLQELSELGVDERTPNVALLSHADLLRRLSATPSLDIRTLDPVLQECVASHYNCFAYEIEQTHMNKRRFGGFWADFMNFHKQTDISGWQFDAIVVIKDNVVIYKLWSGKPNIHQLEEERNPLGPLQGFGPSLLTR